MQETTMIRVCAVLVLAGLVGLGAVVVNLQPIEVSIDRINDSMIGAIVRMNATVTSLSESSAGHLFMRLADGNASIAAVMFASEAERAPALRKGDRVVVTGQIVMYRGQLEIILRSVKKM